MRELRLRELTASECRGQEEHPSLTTSGLVSSAHLRPSPHLSISHQQGLPRFHTHFYPSKKTKIVAIDKRINGHYRLVWWTVFSRDWDFYLHICGKQWGLREKRATELEPAVGSLLEGGPQLWWVCSHCPPTPRQPAWLEVSEALLRPFSFDAWGELVFVDNG